MLRVTAVVLLWACVGVAAGQPMVYDTFGPDWSYEVLAGSTVSGVASEPGYVDTADKFTAEASGYITDIWVAMAHVEGANLFELWLMDDAGNVPGDILESWVVEDQATPFDGVWHEPVHLSVTGATYIDEGTDYWLCAHAGSDDASLAWHFAYPYIFETVAQLFEPGGEWYVIDPGFTSAYAIAVPEPTNLGLLALGALALFRRR
jgi:hypothetical protein